MLLKVLLVVVPIIIIIVFVFVFVFGFVFTIIVIVIIVIIIIAITTSNSTTITIILIIITITIITIAIVIVIVIVIVIAIVIFIIIIIILEHDAGEPPESAFNKHSETLVNDTPLEEKKTAFFCRDQSDATIISDLFGEEVLSNFHINSGELDAWPEYLLHVRSCFIVVNASTMNDELNNKSAGTSYKDLLIKATEIVGKNDCCAKPRFSMFG